MFTTVRGHFDGKSLLLDEPPPVSEPSAILVTFIPPSEDQVSSDEVIATILARGPVSIAPLRIQDLIEEGRP